MYLCLNCGYRFKEPNTRLCMGFGWMGKSETCPSCGLDDFELMGKCGLCGKNIPSSEDYCKRCKETVADWMLEAIKQIKRTTKADREDIIRAIVEWLEEE